MIHVGDMLQKEEEKKRSYISRCTSSRVLLRSSRTFSQNNACMYQHEVTKSEYFATEEKGKRQIGCKVNEKQKERQTCVKQQLQICSLFFVNLPDNI